MRTPADAGDCGGGSEIAISASASSVSQGTIVFSNSNNVTFGMSGSTITASATVAGSPGIAFSANSSLQSTGTVVFSNSNNVTFGFSGGTVTASAAAGSGLGGLSASGSVATNGTVVFSNSNNITFGMSGQTVTASAQDKGVGISASASSMSTGTVTFSNSNNISFGLSNGVMTASASYSNDGGVALSAGTQSVSTGTVVFSNSNGISFGMSGSSRITASFSQLQVSMFENFAGAGLNANSARTSTGGGAAMSFQRFSVPALVQATQVDVVGSLTVAGSTQGSMTMWFGLYTLNRSTASLVSSATKTLSFTTGAGTNSSEYGGQSGIRYRSFNPGATWNVTPGEYLAAYQLSQAGAAGTTGSWTIFGGSRLSILGDEVNNANYTNYWGNGLYSVGTNALPASLTLGDLQYTGQSNGQVYFRLIGTF